ncbi:hypothetical protein FE257_011121 [Aspergillus nanangensis]|uniref:Uncharacterized protein n=1 Tax=Aspergillus nanangensis TaxID=2582783 RepID=A0AAD4CHT0_ASPNN|nr:hypothetical protein FE257_011121 [Aspergillus nanangensis]
MINARLKLGNPHVSGPYALANLHILSRRYPDISIRGHANPDNASCHLLQNTKCETQPDVKIVLKIMSLSLNGVALVTGAGSSIGRQCALGYATEGVRGILLADLDYATALDAAQESETVATNPAFTAAAIRVDVTDMASVADMINAAMRKFGRVDYYVHCIGMAVATTEQAEIDRVWEANARGTFQCIHAVTSLMEKQPVGGYKWRGQVREAGRGTIITVGAPNSLLYGQTTREEYGILPLVQNAALEHAVHGIRVNAVCPGLVETRTGPGLDANLDPDIIRNLLPMSRTAQPEEIADIVLFLSSPRASYVTGAAWAVDGGMALQIQRASKTAAREHG